MMFLSCADSSRPYVARRSCDPQGELLLRCDELRDALWALCDARADAAEAERLRLAGDGAVVDQVDALAARYATLAQVEADRFLGTARILQVRGCRLAGRAGAARTPAGPSLLQSIAQWTWSGCVV